MSAITQRCPSIHGCPYFLPRQLYLILTSALVCTQDGSSRAAVLTACRVDGRSESYCLQFGIHQAPVGDSHGIANSFWCVFSHVGPDRIAVIKLKGTWGELAPMHLTYLLQLTLSLFRPAAHCNLIYSSGSDTVACKLEDQLERCAIRSLCTQPSNHGLVEDGTMAGLDSALINPTIQEHASALDCWCTRLRKQQFWPHCCVSQESSQIHHGVCSCQLLKCPPSLCLPILTR